MTVREMTVRKNPKCPICGPNPTIRSLIDYNAFCGVRGTETAPAGSPTNTDAAISPRELKTLLDRSEPPLVLDVRNPEEIAICRIGGSMVIPLPELANRLGELDRSVPMIVHCKSGVRSAKAMAILTRIGLLAHEGPDRWHTRLDPRCRSQPSDVLERYTIASNTKGWVRHR